MSILRLSDPVDQDDENFTCSPSFDPSDPCNQQFNQPTVYNYDNQNDEVGWLFSDLSHFPYDQSCPQPGKEYHGNYWAREGVHGIYNWTDEGVHENYWTKEGVQSFEDEFDFYCA